MTEFKFTPHPSKAGRTGRLADLKRAKRDGLLSKQWKTVSLGVYLVYTRPEVAYNFYVKHTPDVEKFLNELSRECMLDEGMEP